MVWVQREPGYYSNVYKFEYWITVYSFFSPATFLDLASHHTFTDNIHAQCIFDRTIEMAGRSAKI